MNLQVNIPQIPLHNKVVTLTFSAIVSPNIVVKPGMVYNIDKYISTVKVKKIENCLGYDDIV